MGSYTTQSGSVSYGWRYSNSMKENHNMSIQMIARPLMTLDEIKRIKKGSFVVLKTGANPMKVKIPFYKEWGIEFNDDFYVKDKDIMVPEYISINELKQKIVDGALEVEAKNKYKENSKKVLFEKVK